MVDVSGVYNGQIAKLEQFDFKKIIITIDLIKILCRIIFRC